MIVELTLLARWFHDVFFADTNDTYVVPRYIGIMVIINTPVGIYSGPVCFRPSGTDLLQPVTALSQSP